MSKNVWIYRTLQIIRKKQLSVHISKYISKYARIYDILYIVHTFPHMDSKSHDKGLTKIIKKLRTTSHFE